MNSSGKCCCACHHCHCKKAPLQSKQWRCVGICFGQFVLVVFVTACIMLIYNIIKSRMYAND
uniref:Uncharacterized protein n=1 Tax=Meloidogyne enterolobii TaxID=390850 RepID=A0A6V7V117_MELEN|nr:unnamed protein product [Meloidogyne enterolobii]CAD2168590.1 unnamed protein product [Meloidogyne enterolobii]